MQDMRKLTEILAFVFIMTQKVYAMIIQQFLRTFDAF